MTLITWNRRPHYTDMFENFFRNENEFEKNSDCGCVPRSNILEDDNGFTLEFAVPGMDKNDFNINIEKNIITISADVKENENEEKRFVMKEFENGSFKKSFIIPKSVEQEKIKADYKNGILYVTLPRKQEEQAKISREIKIS